ncbi:hypothetical protein MAP00_006682 [Monascus purpureus]|nr:hypothetical protein MAP00_006682 [Monascus purpureus]
MENFYNGSLVDNIPQKPWPLCCSTWVRSCALDDFALDMDGNIVTGFDNEGSLHQITIQDIPQYHDYLWEDSAATGLHPYWALDASNGYMFDSPPTLSSAGDPLPFCSGATLGRTQTLTEPNTLTICPRALTNEYDSLNLGSGTPKIGTFISAVFSMSATPFHETVYLIGRSEKTPDSSYLWQNYQATLEKRQDEHPDFMDYDTKTLENEDGLIYGQLARRNPENYVWMCVGYWYFMVLMRRSWSQEMELPPWAGRIYPQEVIKWQQYELQI